MKKIILILFAIVLLLGCTAAPGKQVCYQREVKYTEGSPVALCSEKFVEYEVSNLVTKIEPRPTQADHQYDSGTMDFSILNKDKNANGYFNLSMDCVMPSGNTIEKTTIFLAAGEVKKVEFKCSKRGVITELKGPFVDLAPMTENCPAASSAPVEKVRYETVCE